MLNLPHFSAVVGFIDKHYRALFLQGFIFNLVSNGRNNLLAMKNKTIFTQPHSFGSPLAIRRSIFSISSNGIKAGIFMLAFLLVGCTKQKEQVSVCCTMITYARGVEVKRVTTPWYSNQVLGVDTIHCGEWEMIVTMFHRCE